jgi:3-oxoacyl-[acyl-carrier-protein] synthase-1
MGAALANAGLEPSHIGYVNLHGTGTALNDKSEALAMNTVFGSNQPPASSAKPIIGHTLGAAGALELALCRGVLERSADGTPGILQGNLPGKLPVHCWDGIQDEELPVLHLVKPKKKFDSRLFDNEHGINKINYCMSNSFAFGGSNVSIIIGREEGL